MSFTEPPVPPEPGRGSTGRCAHGATNVPASPLSPNEEEEGGDERRKNPCGFINVSKLTVTPDTVTLGTVGWHRTRVARPPACSSHPAAVPSGSRGTGTRAVPCRAVPCCQPGKGPAVTSVPSPTPRPAMELLGAPSPPWWLLLLLLLLLLLWATRRNPWEPQKCPTDLTGKTVIVTGANSGIGKCVAMDLARRNARTILACRNRERGQEAVEEIREATGNREVLLRLLDTGSLASVRAFASAVLREEPRLDVLVNNAGVTGLPFAITLEGLEQTFATNYLGPFLLTNLLLDLLKASAPARVVNVSSFRHSAGTADSGYLTGQRCPGGHAAAYNSTKLMNVLFTAELARRLQGTGVTANAVSPGVVSTSIMRHFGWAMRALFALLRPFMKSAQQGAASSIFCAVSEEAAGITGKYFDSSCRLALPSLAARDAALARKLWEASERLTGLTEQD
nr:retinol dehydrogenase 12-like [Taeniopygia guttata]